MGRMEGSRGAFAHAQEQLEAQGDASVPAQRQDADVTGHDGGAQEVLNRRRTVGVSIKDPVVPSLVFVVDPVEFFVGAVLDAVFGDPLVSVTPALGQDPRHHLHVAQVDLQPLVIVLVLGQPRTAKALAVEAGLVREPGGEPARVLLLVRAGDLVCTHGPGLKPQRPVVRTLWHTVHPSHPPRTQRGAVGGGLSVTVTFTGAAGPGFRQAHLLSPDVDHID